MLSVIALLLLVSVTLGGFAWYMGGEVASLNQEVATQKSVISGFEKDREARAVADKQLKDKLNAIMKEKDKFKRELRDAIESNPCNNTGLPDDAKRLLKELYGSQRSR
jgi:Tfp pilus assembly protein PilO